MDYILLDPSQLSLNEAIRKTSCKPRKIVWKPIWLEVEKAKQITSGKYAISEESTLFSVQSSLTIFSGGTFRFKVFVVFYCYTPISERLYTLTLTFRWERIETR